MVNLKDQCRKYLGERQSDFKFRCRRYEAVARVMKDLLGFEMDGKFSIMDVGAGTKDFGRYLSDYSAHPFQERWNGVYSAVDGSFDGTDLNYWVPSRDEDYFVCIEVLEHLHNPFRLMELMVQRAKRGVVITTPNSDVVDTLGMDSTHITPLHPYHFKMLGWEYELRECFRRHYQDTIVAWYKK